ncbi:MAG TPA: type VI secretion system baseplate subunit TssK [Bryobacteraceae bacterium]|jgi:type VI secretion system protein ImpJ|nr:type VI secretion system baseplate subunit TssK [Bryobacteraceae bacterium]
MRLLSRVVWSEGMYLGPHHFQAQSRYFEDSIQFATASLWFASFGLVGVEVDAEALHNGTVSLVHARGILPDGLPFNMPESDALPEPRAIADLFPPTRDFITVMLAIPPRKPNGYNCSLSEDGAAARYQAESRVLSDENSGADERPVRLGRKNLRILIDTEPAQEFMTLPVARVVRDGSGHYAYDARFMPPLLEISASKSLMSMVKRLIEILDEKAATISRGSSRGAQIGTEFSTREIANFWLLHAVNSALPPLRHQLIAKHGHPEELFVEMSRLAGALCTFALDSHPRTLPLYDHLRLSECFDELERHIRLHLETIVPTNCLSIPLNPAGDYYWEGEVTDQRCMGRSRWVFAIHSNMGEAELMARTPQLIKICTPPFVRELVKRALPGMALTHLPIPPPAISTRVETQYFGISRSGPCWDHMVKARQVGVYIPGEFPNPEVEILVVLDNQS